MNIIKIGIVIILSGCTTYNYTDNSYNSIRVNKPQYSIRDCNNPYQKEKSECYEK